jgi:hypothetical protein
MNPNPYQPPQEVGYGPPVEREPEGWIGVVLWIITLGLGAIVVAGLLRPSFE